MDNNLHSDASSDLSLMSRSPSPPEGYQGNPYNSPPSSQQSSRGTPCPDGTSSNCASSAEDEDSRPVKRRRVSPMMPRDTKRLDLHELYHSPNPEQQAELDRLLKALRKNRKIVVVAGAGISVSAGIPDFRSSTGLFNSLKSQHNLKGSGKELFDAAVYRDSSSTSSFHDMVRSLSGLTRSAKPTPFHHLLARLAHEGRLLRLYSQNVDGIDTSLEPLATKVPLPAKGPWPKTIQLHGGLEKMICTKCHDLSDFKADLFDGPIPPECGQCKEADFARTEVAGKRSHGIGRLRPRMVLYNEHNPDDEAIGAVTQADLRRRPDAIIVVGTSLKIPGVKRIVREMCSIVRNHRDGLAVWINNDPEPTAKEFENCWDLIIRGTCDEIAEHAAMRKWDEVEIAESSVVTEEEARLAKQGVEPQVIVHTPTKSDRFKEVESLPTPAHTPRPDGSAAEIQATRPETKPVSKLVLNFHSHSKTAKASSSCVSIKSKTAKGTLAKNPRSKGETEGAKPASRKPKTAKTKQKLGLENEKIPFKVTKSITGSVVKESKESENLNSSSLKKDLPPQSNTLAVPSHVPTKLENQAHRSISTTRSSFLDTVLLRTPKKPAVERPAVSPFTPPRPIASPFTPNKKVRQPLSSSPSKDNIRTLPRFPNLIKPSQLSRLG